MDQALSIVEWSRDVGILLRLFGSCGVFVKCREKTSILERNGRLPKDIDAVVAHQHRLALREALNVRGLIEDVEMTALTDATRMRFVSSDHTVLDISGEHLRYCQTLDLAGRLTLDFPTISTADLLLSKLQVATPTTGDITDIAALLCAFSFGHRDDTEISANRIGDVVGHSWRWYKAVHDSLAFFAEGAYQTDISADDNEGALIRRRASDLLSLITTWPKSAAWQLRNVFGTILPCKDHVEIA